MRICFCDDEASTRSQFERMAAAWEEQRGEAAELQLYNSAEQLLFEVDQPEAQELAFDLILLDIQMGGMDGITLARQLRAQDKRVTLAFLTAAREYVFEGYEVQAVRYLLKPMQQEKVFELLDLARQNLQEQPSLILNCADEKKKIYLSQIAAIEAQGHYLIFHTTTGQLQQKASLSSLAGHLGDSFVMSHRSFYVNLAHLLRISRTECTLDTGLTVPVSRGAYKNLNEQFIRYYRKEMLE
mgnify:FL=1